MFKTTIAELEREEREDNVPAFWPMEKSFGQSFGHRQSRQGPQRTGT